MSRKRRLLIVVNPYATTVSDRLKNLVVYALQGRYEVEAVTTDGPGHAIEIGRGAREGYDLVVSFGGDGTLNEIINGLVPSKVPVSVLPGGSTNVVARTLGIPNDVVDATEHLLGLADDFQPRAIDLCRAGERAFVFACGAGLDATVVRQVDAHPRLKARATDIYFTWAALSSFYRHYLRDPVRLRVTAGDAVREGVTAVCQSSDPYTYFREVPMRICERVGLTSGTISLAVLRRSAQRDVPTLAMRLLSDRLRASRHSQIDCLEELREARIVAASLDRAGAPRPFPVQVDGDYIGDFTELDLSVEPGGLMVIA